MCGIYFRKIRNSCETKFKNLHTCLKARGPDQTKILISPDTYAAFYRLAIVGLENGMQPFVHNNVTLLCNGEIYNHRNLEQSNHLTVTSDSDCECIMELYHKKGIHDTVLQINGEYAFCIYDEQKQVIHFVRDEFGRKPLFYSIDPDSKSIDICSLYSGLEFDIKEQVVPNIIYTYDCATGTISQCLYNIHLYKPYDKPTSYDNLMSVFVQAVKERVSQSDRPVGFLLSGGFDSSLVVSVALEFCKFKQPPHLFTFGFEEDAPDIQAARKVIEFLTKKHGQHAFKWHLVVEPVQTGLDNLENVIQALETYDTTTIRASTPMYLLSKYIKEKTDVRVILSGEGSDELFGGYMYFKYAPNDQAFRAEICNLLNNLYLYDVLRADRSTAAHGLEIRTPFLDLDFTTTALSNDNLQISKTTTKQLIRTVVAKYHKLLLPEDILNGKKEAFSDAVGYSWKASINQYLESNEQLKAQLDNYYSDCHIHATTYEMKYYQMIFEKHFPNSWHLLPRLWLPNQDWINTGNEPSATVLPNYSSSNQSK